MEDGTQTALPVGKLSPELLAEFLGALPATDEAVRLGPTPGEDAAAIDLAAGTLVAATDPITLTSRDAGRFAVLINANDVAVTGVAPRWFLATVLLPVGTTVAEVRELFQTMGTTLDEIGACLVGGHTEVTPVVGETVVVGQMLGLAPDGRIVTSSGAAPGDVLVQVGPAPVEGAAVLAAEEEGAFAGLEPTLLAAAAAAVDDPGISVVDAALAATRLGASAMHDPTEGGLAGGLHELAAAAGVGLAVDGDAVAWFDPGVALCEHLGLDPWATLASGCLLATFPPERAGEAVEQLVSSGHPAVVVGRVEEGAGVRVDDRELPRPDRDALAEPR